MSEDIAIKTDNLTKVYKLYDTPFDRLKEALNPFGNKYHKEFYALNDVCLEVKKGETVGIVGQNGAGKSTLLKAITGIITPTSGTVAVNGKISALLELGAGFNPQITGLENVYFNGTLLGFTKEEMDRKLEDILKFAEIGDFIHQPVRTYSSGMFVRLAFAVAVHVEPEILIVDEALSVGDATFQSKCFDKIKSMMSNGVTTLFVTHNMGTVTTLCDRAYLIDAGQIRNVGHPKEVTLAYYRLQREREQTRRGSVSGSSSGQSTRNPTRSQNSSRANTQPNEERFGTGTARITDFVIFNADGVETDALDTGSKFSVRVDIEFTGNVGNPAVGVMFKTPQGQPLLGIHSYHGNRINYGPKKAGDRMSLLFESKMLINPGKYVINIGIADHATDHDYENLDSRHNVATVTVLGKDFAWGIIRNPGVVLEIKEDSTEAQV